MAERDEFTSLEDYGFLSSLSWRCTGVEGWCVPRFDSPSVLGALLDPDAGSWLIRPSDDFESHQGWHDDALLVKTVMSTRDGGTSGPLKTYGQPMCVRQSSSGPCRSLGAGSPSGQPSC